ncbi:aminopeptidase P family N-terminal domain-containing protein [Desulfosarcina ovata]|uniref:aminopeptidase P family N-terminal domain-containing protein n=1 Tax=Desulfosarcina ovata TaxID=83564 RepID=UPI0012D32CBA
MEDGAYAQTNRETSKSYGHGTDRYFILIDPINQYYFSGSAQHQIMVIPIEKDPVLWVVLSFERAQSDSWVTDVREASSLSNIFKLMADYRQNLFF